MEKPVKCERQRQLADEYRSATAALTRAVGDMNTTASIGAFEMFRQARQHFIKAKRTVETTQAAMEAHARDHRCR